MATKQESKTRVRRTIEERKAALEKQLRELELKAVERGDKVKDKLRTERAKLVAQNEKNTERIQAIDEALGADQVSDAAVAE